MRPIEVFTRPSAKGCAGPGDCVVQVSIVDGAIKVEPEFVIFNNGRNNTIKIKWEMQTAGYAVDAIEIPDNNEYFDCGKEGNHFSCKNRHKDLNVYKYTIKVTGQPPVPPRDPWLVND